VYTSLPSDYVHDSQSATDSRLYTYSIVSFCYAPKTPSSFFMHTPQKNPLLMIKYELSTSCVAGVFSAEYNYISKWVVQFLSSAKNWPTLEPCYAPVRKFLS